MHDSAIDRDSIPKYHEFMLPVLRAVADLGGTATTREIRETVIETLGADERLVEITYDESGRSVYVDRIDWARSYCKLGGLLDSPKRSLFHVTTEGRRIARLPDAEAQDVVADVNRRIRSERAARSSTASDGSASPADDDLLADSNELLDEIDASWRDDLLGRLHKLSPNAFEEFCMFVLKIYGLELERVGGSGDEGIDGIGTAPLSPVLSARVAVQAKRHDPSSSIGREPVALFQRDAQAKGAERAIFITLSRFTAAARRAAVQATPTVDLIDGERLCELVAEQQIGVSTQPIVHPTWFDRFESA